MLFNSHVFIFIYLPIVLLGYFALSRVAPRIGTAWLTLASLSFYAWWEPRFLPVLLVSIATNYLFGIVINRARATAAAKILLWVGIAVNLLSLSYFKYADFLLVTFNTILGTRFAPLHIELPLGISFFTFTQIAYLVDVHRGLVKEYDALRYGLFVSYFPHLIAGPLLHHKQMMPQFAEPRNASPRAENFAVGLTVLTIGLVKKLLLADNLATFADTLFDATRSGTAPPFFFAWAGALGYALQLYFDFSGYSDMAIGVSRLFGIHLPLNFNSPYKAANIIDFWRRWHMTLSQFLRDYLYIPLGGNRLGSARRHVNLMLTMLLGGLWHGASWTFVAWGGLHGFYLIINHLWQRMRLKMGHNTETATLPGRLLGTAVTFLAVVVAWVFFRADSFANAAAVLRGMAGLNGTSVSPALAGLLGKFPSLVQALGISFDGPFPAEWNVGSIRALMMILIGLTVAWGLPNTQEWLGKYHVGWEQGQRLAPSPSRIPAWRPVPAVAALAGLTFVICILCMERTSKFLYFQF